MQNYKLAANNMAQLSKGLTFSSYVNVYLRNWHDTQFPLSAKHGKVRKLFCR